jgi:hypothetical protein
MPIKFRCPNCQQFLGISRAKAGLITDCPTCGRTIRVPELDGSIKPLPKAELNLKDSELAHALDALARIGDASRAVEADATERAPAHESAAAVAVQPRREAVPVPLPEPVVIAPVLPPEPVAADPRPVPRPPPPADHAFEELSRLAAEPRSRTAAGGKQPASGLSPAFLIAAAGAGFLMFAAGFFVGRITTAGPRHSQPDQAAAATTDSTPAASSGTHGTPEEALPAEPTGSLTTALTGRITYINADGATSPDEGARIIVLPEQREGTAKLAVVGFRAGASPADQQLSRTSLRALGGDYALADVEGHYTIQLPAAGSYHVLLVSRHAPRDDAEFLDPGVQRILSEYFDRPASLVGPVAYHLSPFRFQGASPSPRDHLFDE